MEKIEGYDEAEALTGEYEKLEAGGYVCKIVNVKEEKSRSGKRMLVIEFDIDEGEHKEYYKRRFEEAKKVATVDKPAKWQGIYRQMLEGEKAAGYVKGLMTILAKSNNGFVWDWNEEKLKGLRFGGLFGREEYVKYDGSSGFSTKLRFIRSVDTIKDGKYEIPQDKLLPDNEENIFGGYERTSNSDDDLPF